jgi:hypothetical protein
MSGVIASAAETKAAQAFLKQLGAAWQNNLLILAVVAWFRQESGNLSKVIGNNPFNIRPGITSQFASGIRRSKNGNGYFLVFKTLEAGFAAAAYLLQHVHGHGYELAIKALLRQDPVDFLTALALSDWDAGHYGLPQNNHLLAVYASFTGLQLPPPEPTKRKHKAVIPDKPKYLAAPPAHPGGEFIDGRAAGTFYDARHTRGTASTVDRRLGEGL